MITAHDFIKAMLSDEETELSTLKCEWHESKTLHNRNEAHIFTEWAFQLM